MTIVAARRAVTWTAWPAALIALVVPLVFDPRADEVFAPVKVRALGALVMIGLIALGTAIALGRLPVPQVRSSDALLAAYLALVGVAHVFSVDRAVSLRGEFPEYQGVLTLLGYAGMYALVRLGGADASLRWAIVVVTGVVGAYGLAQRIGIDPVWGEAFSRPFSTIGQANSMAAVLVMGVPVSVGVAVGTAGVRRVVAIVAGVLGVGAVVVSFSRAGWLAVLVGLAVAVGATGSRRVLVAAVVTLAATVILVALGPLSDQAATRIEGLTDTQVGSVAERTALARLGWAMTLERPLLGSGPETFPLMVEEEADDLLEPDQAALLAPYRPESPHNLVLNISTGSGLPAAVTFVAFAVVAMAGVGRTRDPGAVGVLSALAAYLTVAMFMTAEVSSSVLFHALAAWAVNWRLRSGDSV